MKEVLAQLQSFVVMALVLTGLAGIGYNLVREGGWIERFLGNLWGYTMKYPLVVVFVIVGAIGLAWWWRRDPATRGGQSRPATFILYVVMAAGAYFLGRLVLFGTL